MVLSMLRYAVHVHCDVATHVCLGAGDRGEQWGDFLDAFDKFKLWYFRVCYLVVTVLF